MAAAAAEPASTLPGSVEPSSSAERPGSTTTIEEETLAAAERAAWGEGEEEPPAPKPLGMLSPRKTAWVELPEPSFGVPTRPLIGGVVPARY